MLKTTAISSRPFQLEHLKRKPILLTNLDRSSIVQPLVIPLVLIVGSIKLVTSIPYFWFIVFSCLICSNKLLIYIWLLKMTTISNNWYQSCGSFFCWTPLFSTSIAACFVASAPSKCRSGASCSSCWLAASTLSKSASKRLTLWFCRKMQGCRSEIRHH